MTKEEVGKSLPKFFSCKNNTEMWKKLCSIAEEYDGTDLNYYYWMNNYVPEDTPMFRQWANVKEGYKIYFRFCRWNRFINSPVSIELPGY